MHLYTLEVFIDGRWQAHKRGLSATLAAFGVALATLKSPQMWRAVRESDGEVFAP